MKNLQGWAMIPVTWLVLMGAAWAQSHPSAEELINALNAASLQSSQGRGLHRLLQLSEGTPAQAPGEGSPMQPATSESQMASANADLPSASSFVQFSTGSAGLTLQAAAALDELGEALASNALAGYRFRTEGHRHGGSERL